MSTLAETKPSSFYPPEEPEWHRMISEAAYYLAEKRGFPGEHSLDDWLAAEQQVRNVISPTPSEGTMNDTTRQSMRKQDAKASQATEKAGEVRREDEDALCQSKRGQPTPPPEGVSRFEKYAATQGAGNGIEGDVLKPGKTADEKLGANMADRK
jgi:Protein of unknown function (DUF2934)